MFGDYDDRDRGYRDERRPYDDQRRSNESSDIFSDIVDDLAGPALVVIIAFAVVLGGLGWLDSTFGWGLKDWFLGLVGGIF